MFTLKLESAAGTVIDNAVVEAKQTAIRLGVSVEFSFNGVKLHASPLLNHRNSTDSVIKQYGELVSSDREFKFIAY
jgi:hypothetical protein